MSAAVRSTSAFGWKDDPQICAILLGNLRSKIDGDDPTNSRFSPKGDISPRVAIRGFEEMSECSRIDEIDAG